MKSVRLRDVETGSAGPLLRGLESWAYAVSYRPDGRRLAAGGVGGIKVWDPDTGEVVRSLDAKGVTFGLAHSPEGGRIVAVGGARGAGWVRGWTAEDGREAFDRRPDGGPVAAVAYAPDGRRFATAGRPRAPGGRGPVRIWDAATGEPTLDCAGHSGGAHAVAYDPEGRVLVSGGEDRVVRLWDAATGRELAALEGHSAPVLAVAFSPDGRTVASSGADLTIRVWDAADLAGDPVRAVPAPVDPRLTITRCHANLASRQVVAPAGAGSRMRRDWTVRVPARPRATRHCRSARTTMSLEVRPSDRPLPDDQPGAHPGSHVGRLRHALGCRRRTVERLVVQRLVRTLGVIMGDVLAHE